MSGSFVRFPPDSTGKRVVHRYYVDVRINTEVNTFVEDMHVTGATNGFTGDVVGVFYLGTGDAHIYINPDHAGQELGGDPFVVGELLKVDGVTYATASETGEKYFIAASSIAGANNPFQTAYVDSYGALHTTNTEGSPNYDAFGRTQVSEVTNLGEYIHQYDSLDSEFGTNITGTGSITHNPDSSSITIQTGTASGDRVIRRSHLYHPYQAGVSQVINMTSSSGDTGKTNLVRELAYGDLEDAVGFRLNGTSFEIFKRSSVPGVVDEYLSNDQWNGDTVDGSGDIRNVSGLALDVTLNNIFWIDLQWLGAGAVRLGTYDGSRRLTLHTFENANENINVYMRTAALPITFTQENIGVVASTSEMKVFCATVKTEGKFEPYGKHVFKHMRPAENQEGQVYKKCVFNHHPGRTMYTIRPKLLLGTLVNRRVGIPNFMSVTNFSTTHHMNISSRKNATIVNGVWEDFHTDSSFEFDDKGEIDIDNRGTLTGHWMVAPNSSVNIPLDDLFGIDKEKIILDAFGTNQQLFQYSFTAYNLSPVFLFNQADGTSNPYTLSASGNTITKTVGDDFDSAGLVVGHGIYIRNSNLKTNDGYYMVMAVTANTFTVKNIDGSAVTFTGETDTADVTLQSGEISLCFAGFNLLEIQ